MNNHKQNWHITAKQFDDAHKCPRCGDDSWSQYKGDEKPDFIDGKPVENVEKKEAS